MKTIGTNIERIRIEAGLSQGELAQAIGVSPSYISDIERGDRSDIKTSTVRRIANALGCEDGEITDGAEFPPSPAQRRIKRGRR